MRLSVKACLILLLCLCSSSVSADWFAYISGGTVNRWAGSQGGLSSWEQSRISNYNSNSTTRSNPYTYYRFAGDSVCSGNRICRTFAAYAWTGDPELIIPPDCSSVDIYCSPAVPQPVPCESPNYIDPDSGECVAPKEVCFTDLESMADECVFIGEPDPELPEGCVEFQGDQVCLTDDPNCYDVNGKQVCSTPNSVCGFKNGAYECISPVAEGCGYFNGEMVCFTPDGQKVDQDSPDHPQNGGNLDGDDTNDPTDARTPEEGGNPDRQPIDTTGQGEGATEGTAKEQLKALRQLRDDVRNQNKANEGNGAALEQGISSGIGSAGDSVTGQLDDHINGIDTTAPMTADDLSDIESTVSNLFGVSTQCTDIVFGTDELFYTITCQQMDKIRDLLGFLLYGFTVIRLFQIAVRPASKGTP